jgi:soluble epoxide hydrolase/lipid-phosphate phosphatase
LGYGGTDNPADLEAYNFKRMAAHLGELLDYEGVDTAIGVAHDL